MSPLHLVSDPATDTDSDLVPLDENGGWGPDQSGGVAEECDSSSSDEDDTDEVEDDDEAESGTCFCCSAGADPEDWPRLASGELRVKDGVCDACCKGTCKHCGRRRWNGDGVCQSCQLCEACGTKFPRAENRPVREGLCAACGADCAACNKRFASEEDPVCPDCHLCQDCAIEPTSYLDGEGVCKTCCVTCGGCSACLLREGALGNAGRCPQCGKAVEPVDEEAAADYSAAPEAKRSKQA